MTETGRPYGGTNDRGGDEGLPGERAQEDVVGAAPEQSPRAAQGGMSDDVTRVPAGDDHPDGKRPGMPDATGPQG
ncbi:hypothetical protein JOD57_004317 [Geodermatophilus bullaregiensis]|uniref:hypothetical protein n=1 Tax=Geodermatophilus bullaregiensis TaxID=1564160 RepID=UPI0019576112|nr:hypothetical protein [Geodermatophilus bullaregiensis]MBM7808480.1 hypothetical protein [Geodermatophilus bullaregiensis]